jgi:RND family efflux transporter MFP subunit
MRANHAHAAAHLLLLGTCLTGCSKPAEAVAPPPPSVVVTQPVRRDVTLYNDFIGTTRASESVEVRARVSGELEQMTFDPSRIVKEDDLLFVIEQLPYRAKRDAAVATVASAKAQLARADSDLERVSIAVKTDAVSKSDVDLAQANRDVAHAGVLSAEAALEQAELEYSYTEVRSPISGQVGRNLVDVGNVVGGTQPTVLTTVNKLKPLFVYFDAPEEAVLRALRSRDWTPETYGKEPFHAFVGTLVDDGFPYEGVVDFISNTVDAATGTIEIRLSMPNEDLHLFPGLFVRVRAPREEVPNAVLVEERAIGTDLGGRFVYLVGNDSLVEQRYVELGPVQDDSYVPINSGLEGNETYIVEGLLRARPGMPVTAQTASASSNGNR